MNQQKKRYWPWILLTVFLLLAGTVAYYMVFPKKLAKLVLPDFDQVETVKGTIRHDSLYLEARGLFVSRSFLPLVVDSLWYSFYVEDCVLYAHKKKIDTRLWPGQSDTVNLDVRVPFDRIRHISSYIRPKDSVIIGMDAEVTYLYFGRRLHLSFTKEGKILRPVPPRIVLAGVEKKKIKDWGKEVATEAELQVINDNKKLDLSVTDLEYEIKLGDQVKGSGRYKREVSIHPQSSITIRVPLVLRTDHPLRSVYKMVIKKEKTHYELVASGIVDFHAKKQPGIRVDLYTTGETDFSLKEITDK